MAGHRVTAIEMADVLGISRNAAQARIARGFSADDLIKLSRNYGFSPVHALVELGAVTYEEVFDLLDGEGQLVASADEGELAIELARRLNPATRAPEIDELAARRKRNDSAASYNSVTDDGLVADSSPDEDELRRGEDGEDLS